MYKVITSFWSKPTSSNKTQLSTNSLNDEESWVFVSDNVVLSPSVKNNSTMTNSWIASPPLIRTDESPGNVHHFNPIENLLIEHASMSVYEQIASKTRNKRQRKFVDDNKLDEQAEENGQDGEIDDDDDRTSVILQHPNLTSVHHRSSNSSTTTLESSTSSLVAHHRHLHRRHQRRKRSAKSSSKLLLTTSIDESKQIFNKNIERQRLNHTRTPKVLLHQPPRSNH